MVFVSGRSLEKLIEIEFTEFHAVWVADGKPSGAGLSRKYASFWTSGQAKIRCMVRWLFQTPEWATEHEVARNLMARMRVAYIVALVPLLVSVSQLFFDRN